MYPLQKMIDHSRSPRIGDRWEHVKTCKVLEICPETDIENIEENLLQNYFPVRLMYECDYVRPGEVYCDDQDVSLEIVSVDHREVGYRWLFQYSSKYIDLLDWNKFFTHWNLRQKNRKDLDIIDREIPPIDSKWFAEWRNPSQSSHYNYPKINCLPCGCSPTYGESVNKQHCVIEVMEHKSTGIHCFFRYHRGTILITSWKEFSKRFELTPYED